MVNELFYIESAHMWAEVTGLIVKLAMLYIEWLVTWGIGYFIFLISQTIYCLVHENEAKAFDWFCR